MSCFYEDINILRDCCEETQQNKIGQYFNAKSRMKVSGEGKEILAVIWKDGSFSVKATIPYLLGGLWWSGAS